MYYCHVLMTIKFYFDTIFTAIIKKGLEQRYEAPLYMQSHLTHFSHSFCLQFIHLHFVALRIGSSRMAPCRLTQPAKSRRTYVVFRGRVSGIYDNWPECHEQVHGFPSKSHRAFINPEEVKHTWLIHLARTATAHHSVALLNPIDEYHSNPIVEVHPNIIKAVRPHNHYQVATQNPMPDCHALDDLSAGGTCIGPPNTNFPLSVFIVVRLAFLLWLVFMMLVYIMQGLGCFFVAFVMTIVSLFRGFSSYLRGFLSVFLHHRNASHYISAFGHSICSPFVQMLSSFFSSPIQSLSNSFKCWDTHIHSHMQ